MGGITLARATTPREREKLVAPIYIVASGRSGECFFYFLDILECLGAYGWEGYTYLPNKFY